MIVKFEKKRDAITELCGRNIRSSAAQMKVLETRRIDQVCFAPLVMILTLFVCIADHVSNPERFTIT